MTDTKFTKGEWQIYGDWGIKTVNSHDCHISFESYNDAHLLNQSKNMYKMIESLSKDLELAITRINVSIMKGVTQQTETQPDLWDMELSHDAQLLLKKARGE